MTLDDVVTMHFVPDLRNGAAAARELLANARWNLRERGCLVCLTHHSLRRERPSRTSVSDPWNLAKHEGLQARPAYGRSSAAAKR